MKWPPLHLIFGVPKDIGHICQRTKTMCIDWHAVQYILSHNKIMKSDPKLTEYCKDGMHSCGKEQNGTCPADNGHNPCSCPISKSRNKVHFKYFCILNIFACVPFLQNLKNPDKTLLLSVFFLFCQKF